MGLLLTLNPPGFSKTCLGLFLFGATTDKGVADEFELEAGDETLDLLLTSLVSFGTLSFF